MVGKRITQLRKQYSLTQKELADRLNLTPKAISFYELGQREPSIDLLKKLSTIFDVSLDYLIGNNSSDKSTVSNDLSHVYKEGLDALQRADNLLNETAKNNLVKIMNAFIDSFPQ